LPWQKVTHPVYGEIEVGGFNKNFGRLHPGFMLESDAHRNAAFCIYNAYQSPKLEIQDLKIQDLPEGLKEVTATIENKRLLPTHSASNLKYRIDPPDYISLEGGKVIAGMIVKDADRKTATEQKKNPDRLEISNISGYERVKVKWIVKGGKKYTVNVISVKGGRASSRIE
jgi:hypothetical protein